MIETQDCIIWTKSILKNGYGQDYLNGAQTRYAHRIAWIKKYGSIPKGLLVLHKCDVRNCVNPNHLFLGTHKDNTQDMLNKKRGKHSLKTHCKHGHEFSKENTYKNKRNHRYCKTCRNAQARIRYNEGAK